MRDTLICFPRRGRRWAIERRSGPSRKTVSSPFAPAPHEKRHIPRHPSAITSVAANVREKNDEPGVLGVHHERAGKMRDSRMAGFSFDIIASPGFGRFRDAHNTLHLRFVFPFTSALQMIRLYNTLTQKLEDFVPS